MRRSRVWPGQRHLTRDGKVVAAVAVVISGAWELLMIAVKLALRRASADGAVLAASAWIPSARSWPQPEK